MIYQYKCCMVVACMKPQKVFIFAATEVSRPSDSDQTGCNIAGNDTTNVMIAKYGEIQENKCYYM